VTYIKRKSKTASCVSKIVRFLFLVVVSLFIVTGFMGCSSLSQSHDSVEPLTFTQYQQRVVSHVESHRKLQEMGERELQWNSPQQWLPQNQDKDLLPQKGILLVHGLGDSPWSFNDIAQEFAVNGYLVRTVLLPGHGTNPEEMLSVSAEQWREVVFQQAKQLEADVAGPVYLGGFSTGANLILDYAYQNPSIDGLALFSPGFKSSLPFQWVTPALSKVRPWLMTLDNDAEVQTPVRYMAVPTNGFAQFYRTSVLAQKLLEKPYDKPVVMIASEHDSVIDTQYLVDVFQNQFTNPYSRLIWYGEPPNISTDMSRVLVRTDRIVEQRISQFSHMGILFSPDNYLYGSQGELRICFNNTNTEERKACEEGDDIWFSAWGYQEEGKVHARLTYNPYFKWQNTIMLSVFEG
jgi:esterase/lipase